MKEEEAQRGELYHTVTTSYQRFLAGPVLGTIIAGTGAVETFLRYCMRAFLERDLTNVERACGPTDEILNEVSEYLKPYISVLTQSIFSTYSHFLIVNSLECAIFPQF